MSLHLRPSPSKAPTITRAVVFERYQDAIFAFEGIPVEAFGHDPSTLVSFVDDDPARRRPSILNTIAEGQAIGRNLERVTALRKSVSARLKTGPPVLTQAELDGLRYETMDAVEDLRGERGGSELLAIGAMLDSKLAEPASRGHGLWGGVGKWTLRVLTMKDHASATASMPRFERFSNSVGLVP